MCRPILAFVSIVIIIAFAKFSSFFFFSPKLFIAKFFFLRAFASPSNFPNPTQTPQLKTYSMARVLESSHFYIFVYDLYSVSFTSNYIFQSLDQINQS